MSSSVRIIGEYKLKRKTSPRRRKNIVRIIKVSRDSTVIIYEFSYDIFTQDCLFSTNQIVINESPAFVVKHLQRNPMADIAV